MNQNIDFDELFVIRLQFQDSFENENDIIRELKYVLLDKGILPQNIPGLLKEFYEKYGINVTIEKIKEALNNQFNSGQNIENNILQLLNNYIQEQINNTIHVEEDFIDEENNEDEDNDEDEDEDEDNVDSSGNQQNVDSSGNQQNVDSSGNQQSVDSSNNQENINSHSNQQNVDSSGNPILLANQLQQLFVTMSSGLNGPSFQIVSGNNHGISIPFNIGNEYIAPNQLLPVGSLDNLLNNLFQPMLPPLVNFGYDIQMMQPMNDVRSTLDDEDSNNIKKIKVEKKLEEKCSVCMSFIDKDEEMSELPCTHYFHSECIEPWLKKYNYKCPVCRTEVGKPKYNI